MLKQHKIFTVSAGQVRIEELYTSGKVSLRHEQPVRSALFHDGKTVSLRGHKVKRGKKDGKYQRYLFHRITNNSKG